jgi:hypothetical protein
MAALIFFQLPVKRYNKKVPGNVFLKQHNTNGMINNTGGQYALKSL